MPTHDPTETIPPPQVELTDGTNHSTATGNKTTTFNPSQFASAPQVEVDCVERETATPPARYEIRRQLGSGAFGTVSLAWDHQLQREVAIKRPLPNLSQSDKQTFLHEAQLAAQIRHPFVVVVHDVQIDEQGDPFIVYEYLPGESLRKRLKTNQPLPVAEAIDLATKIAEGLAAAHKQGLTHRDLKPANILLDNEGQPRIADFGLAIVEGRQYKLRGQVAGTHRYMAPEQVRGEAHHLDGRTDLWALGVIIYQLLTGRHPFPGETPEEILDQILHREPRPPRQWVSEIPKPVEDLVLKLLAKPMSERYASAGEVVEKLSSQVVGSSQSQSAKRLVRWLILPVAACIAAFCFATAMFFGAFAERKANFTDNNFPLGVWTEVLNRERGVGEIVFPVNGRRLWDDSGRSLTLISESIALLELGSTDATDFTIELAVRAEKWDGDVGLFLGYGASPRVGHDEATLIGVTATDFPRNLKGTIVPRILTLERSGVQFAGSFYSPPLSSQSVPLDKNELLLRVDVVGGAITGLFLDHNPLKFPSPDKVAGLPCRGRFGVFTVSGTASFSNCRVRIISIKESKP